LQGRYDVETEIGRGGMAVVFRALDLKHQRPVAIKLLNLPRGAAAAERFAREVGMVARLRHPHILPLFDSGEVLLGADDRRPYFVMPLASGETLRSRLERERRLPLRDALRFTQELASALRSAHAEGIVHRDIKPENILLDGGHAVVMDFGIARHDTPAEPSQLTGQGFAVGTPAYMSPEQIRGRHVDARTDQYALACVLHEMLVGRPPFVAGSVPAVLAQHVADEVPRVRRLRPDVPVHVEQALQKALAKAPEARFPDVAGFASALLGPSGRVRAADSGRWLLLGALATLAVAVAVLWGRRTGEPAAELESAVAILPFSVNGQDSMNLGPGMVSLLGTKFDGAGDLRSVDARALLGYMQDAARPPYDPATGSRVARHFSARYYVLGDLFEVAGRLRVFAAFYEVGRERPVATAESEGESVQLFALVDSVVSELLAARGTTFKVSSLAAYTTASLPALKAFLEGEQALRIGDFDGAAADYGRAVQTDSTFALAWYRLSEAGEYLLRDDLATGAAAAADRWSSRLPERERTLLAARLAARRGHIDAALELLAGAARSHPDDVEAWTQLAEIRFHYGPWRGESITLSREPWRRALALDPGLAAAPLHLGRIAAIEGKREVLDSLLGLLHSVTRRPPGGSREQYLEERVLRAFVFGDSTEQAARLAELRGAAEVTQGLSLWSVAVFGGEVEAALRIAYALADSSLTQRVRVTATGDAAWLLAAQGRWGAAADEIERLRGLDGRLAVEFGALLDVLPFREVPEARRERWHAELLTVDTTTPSTPGASSWFLPHRRLHGAVRDYLLALTAARVGRLGALGDAATSLARDTAVSLGAVPPDLARGLHADAAWRRGDPASAARALEGLQLRSFYQQAASSPFSSLARERWLLAEALASSGEPEAALRWFQSFEHHSIYDLAYAAPAAMRRGELLERLGRAAEAAAAFRRAIHLWRACDEEGLPLRRRAENGLSRVTANAR
jgi:tetratricopeptide (TPR) repeat protein